MKPINLLKALPILMAACGEPVEMRTPVSAPYNDVAASKIETEVPVIIELAKADLDTLRAIMDEPLELETKLRKLGYVNKHRGVFITTDKDKNGKPSSWITATRLGSKSMISYKTSSYKFFRSLREEMNPSAIVSGDITSPFVKFDGNPYSYEFYMPEGGVNTTLNEYYEIIVYLKGAY